MEKKVKGNGIMVNLLDGLKIQKNQKYNKIILEEISFEIK